MRGEGKPRRGKMLEWAAPFLPPSLSPSLPPCAPSNSKENGGSSDTCWKKVAGERERKQRSKNIVIENKQCHVSA